MTTGDGVLYAFDTAQVPVFGADISTLIRMIEAGEL